MKVALLQIDGSMPNLALMKLSSYHKEQGDTVMLLGRYAGADVVYASVVFTKSRPNLQTLLSRIPELRVGGTGYSITGKLDTEIEMMTPDYSLYGIDYGLGFITRGCPRLCDFCIVPEKEGNIWKVADVADVINPLSDKLILLDNNLLAYPDCIDILGELRDRKLRVNFCQGLDIRLLTPEICEILAGIRLRNRNFTRKNIHFAWDSSGMEKVVRDGVQMLKTVGFNASDLMFYMLCGYGTTREEDWHRFNVLRSLGVDPFVMLYEGMISPELRQWSRWINRRLYKSCEWERYSRYRQEASLI